MYRHSSVGKIPAPASTRRLVSSLTTPSPPPLPSPPAHALLQLPTTLETSSDLTVLLHPTLLRSPFVRAPLSPNTTVVRVLSLHYQTHTVPAAAVAVYPFISPPLQASQRSILLQGLTEPPRYPIIDPPLQRDRNVFLSDASRSSRPLVRIHRAPSKQFKAFHRVLHLISHPSAPPVLSSTAYLVLPSSSTAPPRVLTRGLLLPAPSPVFLHRQPIAPTIIDASQLRKPPCPEAPNQASPPSPSARAAAGHASRSPDKTIGRRGEARQGKASAVRHLRQAGLSEASAPPDRPTDGSSGGTSIPSRARRPTRRSAYYDGTLLSSERRNTRIPTN